MRQSFLVIIFLISVPLFSQNKPSPKGFTENKGQIIDQKGNQNKKVLYLLNTTGLNVQLRKNGFSYDVYETKEHPLKKQSQYQSQSQSLSGRDSLKHPDYSLEYIYHRIDIDFENSNPNVQLIAEGKSSDFENYYNIPSEPNGILGVHKYQKVTYQNIYPDIDVVFLIPEDQSKPVEYNFIVKPNARISDIRMKFKGAQTDLADNKIKMNLRFGQMEEVLPKSWIENDRKEVAINFKKIKNNTYGFETSENLIGKKVVIDPVPDRLWGTFYGKEGFSYKTLGPPSVATDSAGNSYLTGTTIFSNSSYATSGAYQTSIPQQTYPYPSSNGIIVKFNSDGYPLWGTYYGGKDLNEIRDVKTDSQNNVIVTGITKATTNISTPGAYKANLSGSSDAFLAKFNSSGAIIWATYYGGENEDSAHALSIDSNDNIYIVGSTQSQTNLAYNSKFQQQINSGNPDGFLAKFEKGGNLIWSTYVGGEGSDTLKAVTVKENYLVTGGYTTSLKNISTPGVFQENHSPTFPEDGIVYKFSLDGQRTWATYYGGEAADFVYAVEADDENNIYFGGQTSSTNGIATPYSFDSTYQNKYAGFLAKLDKDGKRLWGTYLGSATVYSLISKNSSIYVGAKYESYLNITKFITPCSYNVSGGTGENGYISKFSKQGNLLWGGYAGNLTSLPIKIAFDSNNALFISGSSKYYNGITDSNSYQPTILGQENYYLMKFYEGTLCVQDIKPVSNTPVCAGDTLSFSNVPSGYYYEWTGPNGFTSKLANPAINNANSLYNGTYTLTISDGNACGCKMTYKLDVFVANNAFPVTGNPMQNFCTSQNPTLKNIVVSGTPVWYDSAKLGNILPNDTPLTDGFTYYATQKLGNCESPSRLAVTVNLISELPANDYIATICDDLNDGTETTDLESYISNIIANSSNYTFRYFTSPTDAETSTNEITNKSDYKLVLGENKIYVRTVFKNQCYRVTELKLIVTALPVINMKDTYSLCKGENIIIKAGPGFNSYLWSTGETSSDIKITEPGDYSITVTQKDNTATCSSTKSITVVESNIATITGIETQDWTDNENKITILATGEGNYEYSVDGKNYQDSNEFTGLSTGQHTVYVRDKNGCGISSEEAFLLTYPKFFTPNGDGQNDSWSIKFSASEPGLTVEIYDRYQKLMTVLNGSESWDGKYNGYDVSSSDYWFIVNRSDGKQYKGHFSLKR